MINHRTRILLVAPHADDELYGAGGSLLKWKEQGAVIKFILVACSGVQMRHRNTYIEGAERWAEFMKAVEILSTNGPEIYGMKDTQLDIQPLAHLVTYLDKSIADFDPTWFFFPEASYHQDHQYVNRACIASLRPSGGRMPEKVFEYEVPTSTWHGPDQSFKPTTYSNITAYLDRKVDVFRRCYPSQHTDAERGRLAEHGIRQHALYRGIEVGAGAAEAFRLLREII